jgi:hypothetical protein
MHRFYHASNSYDAPGQAGTGTCSLTLDMDLTSARTVR